MADIIELLKTGDSANRVDIVIVAEGYTAAERDKFIADAQKFLKTFLGQENAKLNAPFSNYDGFFNATALFFASAQSGMDQPNNNIEVDTYFNSSQYLSDGRLLYGDAGKVQFEVSKAMAGNAQELIIVLVNTSIYGGAGGSVAWASAGNSSASELALHEIGHSYAGLQDEYVDTAVAASFPLDAMAFLNSAHVTNSLSRIPWKDWLGYVDGDLGVIGTYEGGYYRSTGIWRATQNSKMLSLGKAFSAPEKEAFALKYYADIGDYLSLTSSIPGIYQPVTPNQNTFSFTWKFDGKIIATNTGTLFDAYANGGYAAGNKLSLTTIDKTGIIRKNISSTQQIETIQVTSNTKQITDVSYSFVVSDNNNIVQFNDANNILKIDDINLTQRIYIDGGAGNDILKLSSSLVGGANLSISQMSSGTVLLSKQGMALWAVKNVESLIFNDFTVNLNIKSNAAGISKADLSNLIDIYVAYFNRIPEADGLNYWITQFKSGMSMKQIGDSFYESAVTFPDLTGYNVNMSNTDFINIIYKNALGRSDGADAGGLAYWLKDLESGKESKGSMVNTILGAVHIYKGDATWGWVANLLDNKITVGNKFAVEWGLGYASAEDAIVKGMQLAALVTPTDIQSAITLIGIAEGQIVFA
jgi:hypothetical protein